MNRQGVVDKTFNSNFPREDWLSRFTKRYELTKRLADNVTSARKQVNTNIINDYSDHLYIMMENVNPENCFNYDETNVTDNPGVKKVIAHKGKRRIERKEEHLKQSTSIMFCGNALGQYLAPMVVYKAKNLYSNWTEGVHRDAYMRLLQMVGLIHELLRFGLKKYLYLLS